MIKIWIATSVLLKLAALMVGCLGDLAAQMRLYLWRPVVDIWGNGCFRKTQSWSFWNARFCQRDKAKVINSPVLQFSFSSALCFFITTQVEVPDESDLWSDGFRPRYILVKIICSRNLVCIWTTLETGSDQNFMGVGKQWSAQNQIIVRNFLQPWPRSFLDVSRGLQWPEVSDQRPLQAHKPLNTCLELIWVRDAKNFHRRKLPLIRAFLTLPRGPDFLQTLCRCLRTRKSLLIESSNKHLRKVFSWSRIL